MGDVRSSPLAQRIRLGHKLLDLRNQAGMTHASLAKAAGVSPTAISRLENPLDNINRKPALLAVRKLLDALGVRRGSPQYVTVEGHAEAGAERGWWEAPSHARMGSRQKTFAVVEAGASHIRDYAAFLLPGLVQTANYARYRAEVGTDGPNVDAEAIVDGRLRRQQQLADSNTRYDLVLEEQTIRRFPVPAPIMLDQLRHLLALAQHPRVSVRVLLVDAQVANGCGAAPRSPFAHHSYPDKGDPKIVTVDTVTTDLLVTGVSEVEGYAQLHERLRGAALPDADSVALIREVADSLAATT